MHKMQIIKKKNDLSIINQFDDRAFQFNIIIELNNSKTDFILKPYIITNFKSNATKQIQFPFNSFWKLNNNPLSLCFKVNFNFLS